MTGVLSALQDKKASSSITLNRAKLAYKGLAFREGNQLLLDRTTVGRSDVTGGAIM